MQACSKHGFRTILREPVNLHTPMNKTAKTKKSSAKKSTAKVKDLKPKKNPKGGILTGLLLPAVQKVRQP